MEACRKLNGTLGTFDYLLDVIISNGKYSYAWNSEINFAGILIRFIAGVKIYKIFWRDEPWKSSLFI